MDPNALAYVNYLIREKFHGSALIKVEELLQQSSDNGHLLLLKAFCLSFTANSGKASDAIRLLKRMDGKFSDYQIAILYGLRMAYSNENKLDRESLKETEKAIQQLAATSNPETATYSAAILLALEGNYDKARPLIAKIATPSTTNSSYLTLRGWLEVLSGRDMRAALEMFEKSILINKSAEAFLGKAKVFEKRQNAAEMKTVLNSLISANPTFLPGYIELIKTSAMTRNWDEVNELVQKIALFQNQAVSELQNYLIQGSKKQLLDLENGLAECCLTALLKNANMIVLHAKRSTILPLDIRLARRIRGVTKKVVGNFRIKP
uniref:Histone H2A/H2B/H3 domain-containing protein n=1 Tax=Ditylenchus dipsaci TaxID=166011 RepID=A0A915CUD6_9BILA